MMMMKFLSVQSIYVGSEAYDNNIKTTDNNNNDDNNNNNNNIVREHM